MKASRLCIRLRRGLLLAAIIVPLLPLATAHADIGPKPSMKFAFDYEIDPVSIVEGELIECEDETCADGKPLEPLGPQNFECTESACSSIAYGYAPYLKLVITFTDRTRESNVFSKEGLATFYKVTVSESSLQVKEVSHTDGGQGCPALAATIAMETVIALAYLGLFHLPRAVLGWVPLSSALSLPVVWLLFPQLGLSTGWTLAL